MDTTADRGDRVARPEFLLDDRYRVGAVLARGGMSTVFRGVDTRLDRPVAIKIMDPAHTTDPAFLIRFEREARLASAVRHPGVVQVYDQGRDGEVVYLVMELIDGGTLRDLLRHHGPLPVEVAVAVLDPLLSALSAAHDAGLIHRDVKPENVLISAKGEIKVADFGLVRAVSSATMATGDVILGTVAYLSPEQVETGASDTRSDVYAAGIVAWEMLTGYPPYSGDNAITVAYQHVHSDVPPVTDIAPAVPVELDDLILAATRRNPDSRPRDAGEFLWALRSVSAEAGLRPVAVPVPSRRPPADDPSATRPAVGPGGTRMVPSVGPGTVSEAAGEPTTAHQGRPRRRSPLRRWLIVLILLALLGTAAAFGGWWLGSGRWATVPDWSGQTRSAAESAAREAGLVPEIIEVPDSTIPAGQIVEGDLEPGTRELRGSTVRLTVSSGRPTVPAIPSGTSPAAARTALEGAGLRATTGPTRYDDTVAAGAVIGTDPAAGSSVPVGAPVRVIVSLGAEPVAVPRVSGKEPEDARNAVLASGLAVGPDVLRYAAGSPDGTIVGTQPGSGVEVPRGSEVSLVIARSVTVPDVAGLEQSAAVAELQDAGISVSRIVEDFDSGVDGGLAASTRPAANSRIDPADPQVVLVLSTSVTVPDITGRTVGTAEELLTAQGLRMEVSGLFGGFGTVLSQDPEGGSRVQPGSTVTLGALF